jgi:hypothetical protein
MLQQAERPPYAIRWWVPLLAVLLSVLHALLSILFEHTGRPKYLVATQISVIAFALLAVLGLVVNRLMRLTRLIEPLNRGELMAVFAAMFVSAGISSFGLVDQLVPLIATPFNSMWNVPQAAWDKDVIPHLNEHLFITDPAAVAQFREGFGTTKGVWLKIPWMVWAKPLALWLILVFAIYLMFYSLSMLLYETWARREKLIFPLARLPEELIPEDGAPPGAIPSTTRNGAFWVGFLFVFLLLSYNGACEAGWTRGLRPLAMGLDRGKLTEMLSNSAFQGLVAAPWDSEFGLSFTIIFTAIGIAFLLPLEVSFSLWAYRIIGLLLFLIAIWCAFGSSVKAFPSDWLWQNNFVSSLGAGGLLAFATICLLKLIQDRWAAAREKCRRRDGLALLFAFIFSFGWGGLLFVVSVAVTLGWLVWSGVSLPWGLAFLAIVILVTVGLMRAVAEGGVYWFQIHTGPFHLARLTGAAKVAGGSVLAPLMTANYVLFLDIKTVMAPAMINSLKMEEETRASHRRFHLSVALSILVVVGVAVVAVLYLSFASGADRMDHWFFTNGPKGYLNRARKLISGEIVGFGGSKWIFYLLGAGWVVLSIIMRRRFFWWLHPIGFVMMANPLMSPLWFPFFIGWLCKRFAVKYGGRDTFAKLRPFFIGLILGELMACFFWAVLAEWAGYDHVKIDINRFEP